MISWFKKFFSAYGLRLIWIDLSNWWFVMKTIRKHKNTADWKQYNLRTDWVGRVFTVFNPQSPSDDGDSMEVLRIKYSERLKPINLYIDKLGLSYSVSVAYDLLENSKSYLIVYYPIFTYLTVWKFLLFIIFWVIFFLTSLDSYTWQAIMWFFKLFI